MAGGKATQSIVGVTAIQEDLIKVYFDFRNTFCVNRIKNSLKGGSVLLYTTLG